MVKLKLHYRRLPDQLTIYEQELLYDDGQLIVTRATFKPSAALIDGGPRLHNQEYRAIWFAVAGEWHDLGKIYSPSGTLQGYYCDIIRPLRRTAEGLEIDDLLLDLWIFPDTRRTGTSGRYLVLDEDEFDEALKQGWIEPSIATRARKELEKLIAEVESGRFPPLVVERFRI